MYAIAILFPIPNSFIVVLPYSIIIDYISGFYASSWVKLIFEYSKSSCSSKIDIALMEQTLVIGSLAELIFPKQEPGRDYSNVWFLSKSHNCGDSSLVHGFQDAETDI
ncbi:uncharacterized protein G2W53_020646 [Senna tora]|uniref:Uncharacterized protein n=1 Tax=Senna tora TaxID=362788 RepID=A0A834WH41_9FABA|nr:uncharacterized protein G2W53_020646 [Senna tora]